MPKKIALLIGVSEYGEGIPSLSAPKNDVAAIKQVLEDSSMGAFDRVEALIDPDPTSMRLAVQQLFARCDKGDLVLLYFSGHGITNDNNELYFGTKGTSREFYQATSVAASFIQGISCDSRAKRQVIVLDCCYSGAFAEGWQAKGVELDLQQELGAEGRVVLTSSSATQKSFQHESDDLSLYTQYLVEGIETGAAGKKEQGRIYAFELHDYAKAKVQEVKPKQKPGIITDREGYNILLSQAPVNDPELDYRKVVEKYATEGHISIIGTRILRLKRQELGITEEQSQEIIDEVLAPYRQRLENIKQYQEVFAEAVEHHYPLTEQYLSELQDLQDILGLENRDLISVKEKIIAEKELEPSQIADSTNLPGNLIPSKESTSEETNLNFFGKLLSPFFQMTADDFFKRGLDKQNEEDTLGAIADYSKAIELNPDLAEAYVNRGNAYLNLGEYQEAIADYNKAIELNPGDADAYINRGNAYLNLEEYQEAIIYFNKAIELNPNYPNSALAYFNRGNAYGNLGEYQKAITDYNQAIELNSNYVDAYINRGNAYGNLGEYQEAITDCNKAIELNPDSAIPYSNRGDAYNNLEQYGKAIADCNQAIVLNTNFVEAYSN
ncbi:MAG: tetratricopeptide repeat protein, partial [Cyanobacteria bacterium J06582_2]